MYIKNEVYYFKYCSKENKRRICMGNPKIMAINGSCASCLTCFTCLTCGATPALTAGLANVVNYSVGA